MQWHFVYIHLELVFLVIQSQSFVLEEDRWKMRRSMQDNSWSESAAYNEVMTAMSTAMTTTNTKDEETAGEEEEFRDEIFTILA